MSSIYENEDTQMCVDPNLPESQEAPLSLPSGEVDNCGGLSKESVESINEFLSHVDSSISDWAYWRIGENGPKAMERIPNPMYINFLFEDMISGAPFACSGDPCFGLSLNSPEVREQIDKWTDPDKIDLLNEWLSFARSEGHQYPDLERFFGLDTQEVLHTYVATDEGHVDKNMSDLDCLVSLDGQAKFFRISYSNSLNSMEWTALYDLWVATAKIGLFCSIGFGGGIKSDLGPNACSGTSQPMKKWFGPTSFENASLAELQAGSVGVSFPGLDVEYVSYSELTVDTEDDESVVFDMSGVCTKYAAKAGVDSGLSMGGTRGTLKDFDFFVVKEKPVRSIQPTPPPVDPTAYSYTESAPRLLLSDHFYFKSDKHDVLGDPTHGNGNQETIHKIVRELKTAHQQTPLRRLDVEFTGHSSPKYRDAKDEFEAVEKNLVLSQNRLDNSVETVRAAYQDLEGDYPIMNPITSLEEAATVQKGPTSQPITPRSVDSAPIELEQAQTTNMGSSIGMAETGDPDNNDLRYRRVDIEIQITTVERERQAVPRECE